MDIFRKNLISLMKEKNINQTQLADLLGVKNQSVNQWVKGEFMPRGKRLDAIAKVFGITVNELLYEGAKEKKEDTIEVKKAEWDLQQKTLLAQEREIELLKKLVEAKEEIKQLKNIETVHTEQ